MIAALLLAGTTLAQAAAAPPAGGLTLADAMRLARAHAERIGIAEQDVVQARQLRRQARANLLPQLSLRDELFQQERVTLPGSTPGSAFSFEDRRNELSLHVDQAIFSGLRDRRFMAAADADVRALQALLEADVRALDLEVATAFHGALEAAAATRTLESFLDAGRERLRELDARAEVGLVRTTDVLLGRAQLADDEASLTRARNDMELALEELGFLVATPVTLDALVDRVDAPRQLPGVEGLVELARQNRQELRAAQARLEAAGHEVGLARADWFPTLSAEADYYLDRQGFSEFAQETDWSASLTLSVPLMDGGRTRAAVAAARSRQEQARLELQRLRRDVELQVRSAWLALQSDMAEVATLDASVAAADESHRLLTEEYREGLATNLEVLTAHELLLENRLALDRQRHQVKLGWIAVQVAAGLPVHDDGAASAEPAPLPETSR